MDTTLRSLLIGTAIVLVLVAIAILAVGIGHEAQRITDVLR